MLLFQVLGYKQFLTLSFNYAASVGVGRGFLLKVEDLSVLHAWEMDREKCVWGWGQKQTSPTLAFALENRVSPCLVSPCLAGIAGKPCAFY